MMQNALIIGIALLLLPLLLYFEKRENRAGMVPVKTCLSLLFVVAALLQSHPLPGYALFIVIGLLFCLGGDVFLALPGKKMFLFGLVSFLLGHVLYCVAFFQLTAASISALAGAAGISVFSARVFAWLRPHLGTMKGPVFAYVVVITVMVAAACFVLANPALAAAGRFAVPAGALVFYFSDLFVARDRFVKKAFANRLVGLPLYYTGQFLLAFSVGLMK